MSVTSELVGAMEEFLLGARLDDMPSLSEFTEMFPVKYR